MQRGGNHNSALLQALVLRTVLWAKFISSRLSSGVVGEAKIRSGRLWERRMHPALWFPRLPGGLTSERWSDLTLAERL